MKENHMPTPYELNTAPELAVLAVLNSTLEAATRALIAAYPELCDDQSPRSKLELMICGRRLLSRANKLQSAVARYREAVLREAPKESGAADRLDAPSANDPAAF